MLNQEIIERLKFLHRLRTQQAMMALKRGAKVSFDTREQGPQFGTVIKFNKKTVSVLTEDGRQWNVSPELLHLVKDASPETGVVYTQHRKRD